MSIVRKWDRLLAEFREIMSENTLRFERAMQALSTEIRRDVDAHREESRRYFEVLHEQAEAESRRIDDLLAESRAQRQALLHVLDRLSNGGTSPAA
jgi:predicted phage gp36 major capsid-like protein